MRQYTDEQLAALVDCIDSGTEGYFYHSTEGKLYRMVEVQTSREKGERIAPKSITFHGKQRQATHIIFYLMEGRFPSPLVDHKDRDSSNNAWSNLREATYSQNQYNKGAPGRYVNTHLSMERGVSKIGNRFRVMLNSTMFGSFSSLEEANQFAVRKRKELQGEFMCHVTRRV